MNFELTEEQIAVRDAARDFAQNVLKAHNGKIEVVDNKPKGSVFRIIMNSIKN